MKNFKRHIVVLLLMLVGIQSAFSQKQRYVQVGSIHALSVPANSYYSFDWNIINDNGTMANANSSTHVTDTIGWYEKSTYHVEVKPILDSVSCYGEAVSLDIIVVDYLSLHAFDDVYFMNQNDSLKGDVSINDFDETGVAIIYTPEPIIGPKKGTLKLGVDGKFTYTPNAGFTGIDSFAYEVFNTHEIPMYTSAWVKINVKKLNDNADLYVSKTGPEKALFGERITYNIVVKNFGPTVAQNVVLRDTLAFGLFNAEYSIGGAPSEWNSELNLGDIANGDSVVVYIFTDISKYAPSSIYNQAIVHSDSHDPIYVNNDSIWYTEVSHVYVDLPNQIIVPSCEVLVLPGIGKGNNDISKFAWSPGLDLSDSTIANPIFTPSDSTIGKSTMYVLTITDDEGNVGIDTTYLVVPDVPVAVITGDTLFKDLGEDIMLYGDESIGESLSYFWYTNDGEIQTSLILDSIEIASVGTYTLQISDDWGCESTDSALVLLESHPPVVVNDSVAIQSASDSTINVLINDSDINLFNLHVESILTEPKNSSYTWDSNGNFTITPDSLFWEVDSIEYQVCNDGYPVNCNSGWIIINSLRPPLNADVQIQKTGNEIAYWGDTIKYDINVWSAGPDSAVETRITDILPDGLLYPEYSINNGASWDRWTGDYVFRDSLIPVNVENDTVIRIKIRALVGLSTEPEIENIAWVETEIVENKLENDTNRWATSIKEPVIADAGADILLGSCSGFAQLDATNSSGNGISYRWSPTRYLDNHTSPTPTFTVGETTTYVLTVTDEDGLSNRDTMVVTVLPPPLADAGDDKYIRLNSSVPIDGSGSSPANEIHYLWETTDGSIFSGESNPIAFVDQVGTYKLTVTDDAKCTDSDEVEVFQFYYLPFAIPDYYSTQLGKTLKGNVLDNDYEPNGRFNLNVETGTYRTTRGGTVVIINNKGDFSYTPPPFEGVDYFEYTVCNDAYPIRCVTGFAQITVTLNTTQKANLSIEKMAIQPEALIEDPNAVQWLIKAKNNGPELAKNVLITDSISQYLYNAEYSINGNSNWPDWKGDLKIGDLDVNESVEIIIRATARATAPDTVYNAATVVSRTFDDLAGWTDVANRNVDTAKVIIKSDLIAIAELVELWPGDKNHDDHIVGYCDEYSYLTGINSKSILGIDAYNYQWNNRDLLETPDSIFTRFNHVKGDTTVVFTLTAFLGDRSSSANVTVHLSPELIANAGEDRKKNDGQDLVIDGTGSQGAEADYRWYKGAVEWDDFYNDNRLMPIIKDPGEYILYATDMHGCTDVDTVIVSVNELYAVNDIIVLMANDTLMANVKTNDYDPNLDSIFFTGNIITAPKHGQLLDVELYKSSLKSITQINANIDENGTFIYVPDKGFAGTDYFQYEISDDNDPNLLATGTVFIKVIEVDLVNSKPVANHDYYFINKNDTLRANPTYNDYDFDGGVVRLSSIVGTPTRGSVKINDDNSFTYTPKNEEVGRDSFAYVICDNGVPSNCDTALIIINIHKLKEENHRPVAVDDAYFTVVKTITGNVLSNDYDPDNDDLDIQDIVSGPEHGQFILERDGSFIYTPDLGFEGTDQIVYKIKESRTTDGYESYATLYITSIAEKRYVTNVAIEKFGPATILSGEIIEYMLVVTVQGPSLSNDVIVMDTVFNELDFVEYSLNNGTDWFGWRDETEFSQLLLYQKDTVLIRGKIPKVWNHGVLQNRAYVKHNMGEADPNDNTAVAETNVYQSLIADAGDDADIGACITAYTLDGSGSVGMGNLQYTWSPSEFLDDPHAAKPIFTTAPGETQTFTLAIESSYDGYVDYDTTEVTVNVGIAVNAVAGEDIWPITEDPVLLDGGKSNGAKPLQYLWEKADKSGIPIDVANTVSVSVDRTGDYTLWVTDRYGCKDDDLMHVTYPIDPFDAIDDTVVTPQQTPIDINVLKNDYIDEDDEYDLTLLNVVETPMHGYLKYDKLQDSVFTYIPDDYYTGPDQFTYNAVTRSYNDEAVVYITVIERKPFVPEGFSPNGDGINDVLIISNIEYYEKNSLTVFNRWGNIVYKKDLYDNNDPWNGVANSGIRMGDGALPAGVYFYLLDLGDDRIEISERKITGSFYIATDNR